MKDNKNLIKEEIDWIKEITKDITDDVEIITVGKFKKMLKKEIEGTLFNDQLLQTLKLIDNPNTHPEELNKAFDLLNSNKNNFFDKPLLIFGTTGIGKTSIIYSMRDLYNQNKNISESILFEIWNKPLVFHQILNPNMIIQETRNGIIFNKKCDMVYQDLPYTSICNDIVKNYEIICRNIIKSIEKTKNNEEIEKLNLLLNLINDVLNSTIRTKFLSFNLPIYHVKTGDLGKDISNGTFYKDDTNILDIYDIETKGTGENKRITRITRKKDYLKYVTLLGGGIIFFDEYLRASDDVRSEYIKLLNEFTKNNANYSIGDRWIIIANSCTPYEYNLDLYTTMTSDEIKTFKIFYLIPNYKEWREFMLTESEFAGLEGTEILIEFMDHFIKDENKVVEGSSSDPFKIEFMSYNPKSGFIATTRRYEDIAMELEYSKAVVKDKLGKTYEGSIFDLDLEQFLIFLDSVDAAALSIPAFNDSGFGKAFKDYLETTYAMTKIFDKNFSTDLFYTDKQSELSISNLVAKIENFYKSAKLEIDVKSTTLFMMQRLVRTAAPYKSLPEEYYEVSRNKSIVNTDKILDDIRNKNYKNILTVDECKNINAWISGCTTEFTPFKGEFQKIFALAHPYLSHNYIEGLIDKNQTLYKYLKELSKHALFLNPT